MDIVISCHTEFGFMNGNAVIGYKEAVGGVTDSALNLAKIAGKHKAKITFLVCPETSPYFPKNIGHEVGLHIHPGFKEVQHENFRWFVGDAYLRQRCKQSVDSTALQDYSYQEQFDMIKIGKEYLESNLHCKIKSFVSGRWSVNNDTVKALVENDFCYDLSAPSHSKSDHYDWQKLPRICPPYYPSKNDYQKRGQEPILMIPVSQTLFGGTITPEGVELYGLSWIFACFKEYYQQGVPLFHIFLHSPPMTSPRYISVMEKIIDFFAKHKDVNFKFAQEIKEYPRGDFETNVFPYLSAVNYRLLNTAARRILGIKRIYTL